MHIELTEYIQRLKDRYQPCNQSMTDEESEVHEAKKDLAEEIAEDLKRIVDDNAAKYI